MIKIVMSDIEKAERHKIASSKYANNNREAVRAQAAKHYNENKVNILAKRRAKRAAAKRV
jgi:hypothetical protein